MAGAADMAAMESLLALLVFGFLFGSPAVAGAVVGWTMRGRKERRKDTSVVGDYQRLDRLVEDIQYHAYEQMTLGDGTLAPIVVDLIRSSEKSRAERSTIRQAEQSQCERQVPFIHLTSPSVPTAPSAHRVYPAPVPYEPHLSSAMAAPAVPQAPAAPFVAPPVLPATPAPPPASPLPALPTRAPISEENR